MHCLLQLRVLKLYMTKTIILMKNNDVVFFHFGMDKLLKNLN